MGLGRKGSVNEKYSNDKRKFKKRVIKNNARYRTGKRTLMGRDLLVANLRDEDYLTGKYMDTRRWAGEGLS